MADDDAALREMAAHRGFRLVKSRRRKPGSGDYGKYGLTDAKSGTPCFGFDGDQLTALPEEIAAYLRGDATASWRQSAAITPERPRPAKAPVREPKPPAAPPSARKTAAKPPAAPSTLQREPTSRPRAAAPRRTRPEPAPSKPAPPPLPVLKIRPATQADAPALAELVGALNDSPDEISIAAHIAAKARAKAPLLVAERGGIVGCLDWHVLPTLHRGRLGRITLLYVAERARRGGIGRGLIDAAAAAMARSGCTGIEAISDIEVRNANGFFRYTGFTQTSYRLIRAIET